MKKLLFQLNMAQLSSAVDLVINHGRHDYPEFALRDDNLPMAIWFHNPVLQRDIDLVMKRRANRVKFVGVSRSQMRGLEPSEKIEIVHNCIDTSKYDFFDEPSSSPYLLFLGRLIRNKGVHLAIEVARRAGMRLVIAGNRSEEYGASDYLEREIRPFLSPACEWLGPYDDRKKVQLLRGASALLFPIQWEEPFGLVMIEALACGTPVIALRRGATPEVIRHGQTGFLCDSVDEMISAVQRVPEIDRRACRRDVDERFDVGYFGDRLTNLCASLADS